MIPAMEPAALAAPQSFCPPQTLHKTSGERALPIDARDRDEVAALASGSCSGGAGA